MDKCFFCVDGESKDKTDPGGGHLIAYFVGAGEPSIDIQIGVLLNSMGLRYE